MWRNVRPIGFHCTHNLIERSINKSFVLTKPIIDVNVALLEGVNGILQGVGSEVWFPLRMFHC
jgi:hypothetical protein